MNIFKNIEFNQLELTAAVLLVVALFILLFFLGKKIGRSTSDSYWQQHLQGIRKEIANSSRSIIRGQVSEQIAPYLPGFPFDPAHCRFIGKPVDFLVFHELENPEKCSIILVEVKTGSATLNRNEKTIRDAVKAGRVYYYEYRFNGADKTV